MHHPRACKIGITCLIQETSTPFPVALDGIDESGEDDGKKEKGNQFHPLGNRTGNNRHRGCDKNHLEEKIRGFGIRPVALVLASHGQSQVFQTEIRDVGAYSRISGIHDVKAADEIHDTGNRIQADVLGHDLRNVLGTD